MYSFVVINFKKALISLPPAIAECDDVVDFFDIEPEDINLPQEKKV